MSVCGKLRATANKLPSSSEGGRFDLNMSENMRLDFRFGSRLQLHIH